MSKKAAAANIEVVGEERRRVVEVGRLGQTNQPAKNITVPFNHLIMFQETCRECSNTE
jgi:hypothetical protein